MTERERDKTNSIQEAIFKGGSAARQMVQHLIKHDATNEEICSALAHLQEEAASEAKILLDRRDAEKLVREAHKRGQAES